MPRHLLTILAGVTAALITTGCSSTPQPAAPSTTRTDQPTTAPARLLPLDLATVDTSSADAVALAVATTAYTLQPGLDSDPNDGMKRASALLDQRLTNALNAYRPASSAGAEWSTWTRQHAYITATAALSTQTRPPDGHTALRYLTITQTVHLNRQITTKPAIIVLITLARTPAGWRVTHLTQL
ncbi:hypothetical protein [Nocardia sp. NPDC052566]|uniref:hypothetical protein n=1 Tax=Nocardia sp. NPDC052566 TaxID=3364330 RepID=UPI0037C5A6EE